MKNILDSKTFQAMKRDILFVAANGSFEEWKEFFEIFANKDKRMLEGLIEVVDTLVIGAMMLSDYLTLRKEKVGHNEAAKKIEDNLRRMRGNTRHESSN